MIYFDTEKKLRAGVLEYIKGINNYAQSTIKSYSKDAFNVLENDKGIDFWEMVGNNELSNEAKKFLESQWVFWTNLHSRHVGVTNHTNMVAGIDRINSFMAQNPSWLEIIQKESREVNDFIYKRLEEEFQDGFEEDKLNILVEEFKKNIGPYDSMQYEQRIITYLYIKGFYSSDKMNYDYRIVTDLMQTTLLKMNKEELVPALKRIKENIIMMERNHYYFYDYRRRWLSDLANQYEIEIDLSDDIFIKGIRDVGYSDFDFWTITDVLPRVNIGEEFKYTNYKEKLSQRIAHIPEGHKLVAIENTKISKEDQYSNIFKKGLFVTGVYEVVENFKDGENLRLKLVDNNKKLWYYDTYPNNFSYFHENDWTNKALSDFVFENKPQDIQLYIDRYDLEPLDIEIGESDASIEVGSKDFTDSLFMTSQEIIELKNLILKNKNIILQGAPGVGKTFSAKLLAYSIIGERDDSRVVQVQFHQSYSYEDLVMGYRPVDNGFELKNGPFYELCKVAQGDLDKEYFFIIDEINRGNISKIFGELLMLIEADKRGEQHAISLVYNDEPFHVPSNVFIIGMMNTADRSLAMIDYAFRRRFSFYKLKPAFDNEKFKTVLDNTGNYKLKQLVEIIKQLNKEIEDDDSLGQGFMIGHSYVTKNRIVEDNEVNSIIKYEIIPLLEEYWFDDEEKLNKWSSRLMGVISES